MWSLGFTEPELRGSAIILQVLPSWRWMKEPLFTNYILKETLVTSRVLSSFWQNGDVRNSVWLPSLPWFIMLKRGMSPQPACDMSRLGIKQLPQLRIRRHLRPLKYKEAILLQSPTNVLSSDFILSVLKSRQVKEKESIRTHTFSELTEQGYKPKYVFLSVLTALSNKWSKKGREDQRGKTEPQGLGKLGVAASGTLTSSSSSPEEAAHWLDVFHPPRSWEHFLLLNLASLHRIHAGTDKSQGFHSRNPDSLIKVCPE